MNRPLPSSASLVSWSCGGSLPVPPSLPAYLLPSLPLPPVLLGCFPPPSVLISLTFSLYLSLLSLQVSCGLPFSPNPVSSCLLVGLFLLFSSWSLIFLFRHLACRLLLTLSCLFGTFSLSISGFPHPKSLPVGFSVSLCISLLLSSGPTPSLCFAVLVQPSPSSVCVPKLSLFLCCRGRPQPGL